LLSRRAACDWFVVVPKRRRNTIFSFPKQPREEEEEEEEEEDGARNAKRSIFLPCVPMKNGVGVARSFLRKNESESV
tara:strand:- start:1386 stop:1616 length:231 start_codon:yes stop_codon:yes gene_type:complete